MIKQILWDITHHHQSIVVAGNITKRSQLLSTPINGDMLQNHKMSKRIMLDTNHHHKMIHIIILMDQNQTAFNSSYSTYQEMSSLEQTFNSFMESCQTSPPSFSSENSSSLNYPLTQNLF
ncbi:hypothetical protein AHAS_Ahas05G0164800 [Arachis hypogaea]